MRRIMRFTNLAIYAPNKACSDKHAHMLIWKEILLVAWMFYDCSGTRRITFGVSKLQNGLHWLVRVNTCQNVMILLYSSHMRKTQEALVCVAPAYFKLKTYIFVSIIMNFNTTDCSGELAHLRRLTWAITVRKCDRRQIFRIHMITPLSIR